MGRIEVQTTKNENVKTRMKPREQTLHGGNRLNRHSNTRWLIGDNNNIITSLFGLLVNRAKELKTHSLVERALAGNSEAPRQPVGHRWRKGRRGKEPHATDQAGTRAGGEGEFFSESAYGIGAVQV